MITKNLFFTLIFTTSIQFSYATTLFTLEKTKAICDQLITIYKSNNNIITSDTFVSFIEQHNIENLQQLTDILKMGKEAYQTEFNNTENLLNSNKLSLFLTQIITCISAIGYSHIYQSSSLNCSQNQETPNLNQINTALENVNNILNETNVDLEEFSDYLSRTMNHLQEEGKGYVYKIKHKLSLHNSTPLISDFQLAVDNYLIDIETTIGNYGSSIRRNKKNIDNNNVITSINKSYIDINSKTLAFYSYLDQFKFLYIPLFIAGIAYSSISLYDLYNKYQLRENLFNKIDIINKILKQITI